MGFANLSLVLISGSPNRIPRMFVAFGRLEFLGEEAALAAAGCEVRQDLRVGRASYNGTCALLTAGITSD